MSNNLAFGRHLNCDYIQEILQEAGSKTICGNSGDLSDDPDGDEEDDAPVSDSESEDDPSPRTMSQFMQLSSGDIQLLRKKRQWTIDTLIPCIIEEDRSLPSSLANALAYMHEAWPKLEPIITIMDVHIFAKSPSKFEKVAIDCELLPIGLALEAYLRSLHVKVEVLHAGLSDAARQDLIFRANDPLDHTIEVLIMSSALVGCGLNLQKGVPVMILPDAMRNLDTEEQVIGCILRFGGRLDGVIIYRLRTYGTFEHSIEIRNEVKNAPILKALRPGDMETESSIVDKLKTYQMQAVLGGQLIGNQSPADLHEKALEYLTMSMKERSPAQVDMRQVVNDLEEGNQDSD